LTREIKIQWDLNHPNLIQLYDFFSDESNIYLLLELACDGHLFDLLTQKMTLSEETTSIVVREITEGVNYMHRKEIIHRDIKLENIVLSHVENMRFRAWPKYAISDGAFSARGSSDQRSVAPPSTSLLKSSWDCTTTRKLTPGPSALSPTNSRRATIPSKSPQRKNSPR
jgi:serine/threonine protein kinase